MAILAYQQQTEDDDKMRRFEFALKDDDRNDLIYFHVLQLSPSSLQIWIGEKSAEFDDFAVAFPSRGGSSSTPLFPKTLASSDPASERLAAVLSKKLEKAVFVSFNANPDRFLDVQKRLNEEIAANPDVF